MILSNLKLYVLLMYVYVVHTVDFNQVVFDLSNMSFKCLHVSWGALGTEIEIFPFLLFYYWKIIILYKILFFRVIRW